MADITAGSVKSKKKKKMKNVVIYFLWEVCLLLEQANPAFNL